MSLDRLMTLAEVARRGSITEAAKALGLTQPAASRRLQLLEEEIGAPLLARGRKGVRLTETGKLVAAEGEALLERYDRLVADVRKLQRLEAGTVRLGGGATAVSALLPEVIRRFRGLHKDIVFEVREAGSREIAAAVAREELDLGLVTLPVRSDGLDLAPLRRDRIVLERPLTRIVLKVLPRLLHNLAERPRQNPQLQTDALVIEPLRPERRAPT